jgi:integrase
MKLPLHVRRVRAKGRNYFYFDTGKVVNGKKVWTRLPDIRSPDFGGACAALLGHRTRAARPGTMTIPQLIDLYQRSPAWRKLADRSREAYGIYLNRLRELLPTAPAAEVTRGDMRRLIDSMADRPGAANLFLGTCGALFRWAVKHEYIATSPTIGIERLETGEHAPWPEHVLQAALATDDPAVRLLTHLLYFTALRINDALALTWANITGDRIVVRPQKLRRKGQELSIPLHSALRIELERQPRIGMVIALNPTTGRPWLEDTARARLQAFATAMGAQVVPHGLRKNAVNALLECGCSVAETASISGQTLQMVEHYAKGRNQARLADAAVLKWEGNRG